MARAQRMQHLIDDPPTWLLVAEGLILALVLALIFTGVLPGDFPIA